MLAALLALLPGLARGEAVVLIAHPELVELAEADVGLLRQLFLARRSRVGGRRIHCFEPAPGSPARRAFARSVLERSERELESYWLEQALSGGPPPPARSRTTPSWWGASRRAAARSPTSDGSRFVSSTQHG